MLNKTEIINKIQHYFKDKPVKKAYLFGSLARNEADSKSDIDIMVTLDMSQKIGLKFIRMQIDLQEILGQKVDLVSEGAVSKHILPFIDKDKELDYERNDL